MVVDLLFCLVTRYGDINGDVVKIKAGTLDSFKCCRDVVACNCEKIRPERTGGIKTAAVIPNFQEEILHNFFCFFV